MHNRESDTSDAATYIDEQEVLQQSGAAVSETRNIGDDAEIAETSVMPHDIDAYTGRISEIDNLNAAAAESSTTGSAEASEKQFADNRQIESIARSAYLRGRNEAITAAMAHPAQEPGTATNLTPGLTDTSAAPTDPALAEIFSLRPSVWQ